ncbi:MAG: hypothetical protein RJQ09_20155 [Cyclobacteriaceae bacterium]
MKKTTILLALLTVISASTFATDKGEKSKKLKGSEHLVEKVVIQSNNGLIGLAGYDLGDSKLKLVVLDDDSNLIYKEMIATNGVLYQTYEFKQIDSQHLKVRVFHNGNLLAKSRVELR